MKDQIYSRAPLRISFAGGGTEIPPYVDMFGGKVFSTAISMYATTCISLDTDFEFINIISQETGKIFKFNYEECNFENIKQVPKECLLAYACILYFKEEFNFKPSAGMNIWTSSDAPQGSGLGASSVMSVSIIKALATLSKTILTQNQLAMNAFAIEREILELSGGLQDQFAASFGGLNLIEFDRNRVAQVKNIALGKLQKASIESSLLLIYTGTSRDSANIIEKQQKKLQIADDEIFASLHKQKASVDGIMEAFIKNDMKTFGSLLHESWINKKSMVKEITNSHIDDIYSKALELGAYGGKISGAGGGGFMLLAVPPFKKMTILRELENMDLVQYSFRLEDHGALSW